MGTNKPALPRIIAWGMSGDKILSETMMAKFPDAYMRHGASMSELSMSRPCI